MKAIETEYKGCLFRSRLEARWAVFFDDMGIDWQYEAQGYECTWRLSMCPDDGECTSPAPASYGDYTWIECGHRINYLPDFWPPELKMYAEVKGAMTEPELLRTINAIASLGHNCTGWGYDSLFLGPIPDGSHFPPWRLHLHKGTLMASAWRGGGDGTECGGGEPIAYDCGGGWDSINEVAEGSARRSASRMIQALLRGAYVGPMRAEGFDPFFPSAPRDMVHAYRAARSARFEHGQSGAQLL